MDFKKLKNKAIELTGKAKDKASEKTKSVIDYWAKKLTNSKYTIDSKEELDELIKKSVSTTFKNNKLKKEITYKHKTIVIFAEEWSNFFKDILFALPLMATKSFTQNIPIRLAKSKITWVKLSEYKVKAKTLPCMVIFEEEKIYKNIEWSEKILKLVKSFHLDINKLIEEENNDQKKENTKK